MNSSNARGVKKPAQNDGPKIFKLDSYGFVTRVNTKAGPETMAQKRSVSTNPGLKQGPSMSRPTKMPNKHAKPVKIGYTTSSSQWRCGVCTFLNEADVTTCKTCQSEKGEMRRGGSIAVNKQVTKSTTITAPTKRIQPKKM